MITPLRSEVEVERMVQENERLVDLVVHRYLKRFNVPNLEREDLRSYGLIGLLNAARAWDPTRGRFSTLACMAIERQIARGVTRDAKPEEARSTLSLDALVNYGNDGEETRFVDQVADEQNVESEVETLAEGDVVRKLLGDLGPDQRRLIADRYYRQRPLGEIAREMGTSRQAVHLREKTILKRLRRDLANALN
jgi:RNA polymerase sporulation-specific sigma factor